MLIEKILVKNLSKYFNFFNFKVTEAKFLHNCFWHNLIVYMVFRNDTGKNSLYAFGIYKATPKQP